MGASGSIVKNRHKVESPDDEDEINKINKDVDGIDLTNDMSYDYSAFTKENSSNISILSSKSLSIKSPKSPKSTKGKENINTVSTLSRNNKSFLVHCNNWKYDKNIQLPNEFILRIEKESLDFIDKTTNSPIIQFPYQYILCWGHTDSLFQFNVFSPSDLTINNNQNKIANIPIVLQTNEGKKIEEFLLDMVKKLMAEIKLNVISKNEFDLLMKSLLDNNNELLLNWKDIIKQSTSNRYLLANQGLELINYIGEYAPFEKIDIACLIYECLMNKESFQLIVNSFDDIIEKQNLIYHINDNYKNSINLFTNCKLGDNKFDNQIDV